MLGSGPLWAIVPDSSWLVESPGGGWSLKLAWTRVEAGVVSVKAVQVSTGDDGAGAVGDVVGAEIQGWVSSGYGDDGPQPSTVVFPRPGCWKVTGSLNGGAEVVVLVDVPGNAARASRQR